VIITHKHDNNLGKTQGPIVNPVRNSSGALNPAGIILKSNPATEQRGIISNWVKMNHPQVEMHHRQWLKEKF
jgi:hypothetical protein